jgi:hypothetical protein
MELYLKHVQSFQLIFLFKKITTALAKSFAYAIEKAAEGLDSDIVEQHLEMQIAYTNRFYNWKRIGFLWSNFLKGAINARPK